MIGLLLTSTFVVFLNETIMSVAIPHLMADLGVTASAAQWLTTAFLLTMAVVIPITGFLLQDGPAYQERFTPFFSLLMRARLALGMPDGRRDAVVHVPFP